MNNTIIKEITYCIYNTLKKDDVFSKLNNDFVCRFTNHNVIEIILPASNKLFISLKAKVSEILESFALSFDHFEVLKCEVSDKTFFSIKPNF